MSTNEPKKRRTRRNFERELENLRTYVRVSIAVIEGLGTQTADIADFMKGQLAALKAVQRQMEVGR